MTALIHMLLSHQTLYPEPATESTEAPTEAITEVLTEAPTEVLTEAITEAPTEAPTEVLTEAPTEAITEVLTEAPTEVLTEAPTEATTEATPEYWLDANTLVFVRGDYAAGDMVELANGLGTMGKVGTPVIEADGWAVLNNGSDQYYKWTPPSAMLGWTTDWTLEFYMKTSTTQSSRGVVGRKASGADRWVVFGSISGASALSLWDNAGGELLGTDGNLSDGVEHHIAWVKEGTALRCYLDGVLESSVTYGTPPGDLTDDLTIGTDPASASARRYVGRLDTVRISNVARYSGASFTPLARTAPTEPMTEAPTEVLTEAPTEVLTEVLTEAPTEAPTEVLTEEPVTEAYDFGLRFFGFNHEQANTTAIPRQSRVESVTGGGFFSVVSGRDGYQSWANNYNRFLVPSSVTNELIMGVRFQHGGAGGNLRPIIRVYNSAGTRVLAIVPDAGTDTVQWSIDESTWHSSAVTLDYGQWYWLTFHVVADATTGSMQIAIDGVTITNDTNVNTGPNTTDYHSVGLLPILATTGSIPLWDDLVLTDGLGPAPFDGLLPDMTVSTMYPNSDVSNAWTPSTGSTAYECVDETRVVTTDYITGVNGAEAILGFPEWAGSTPYAVQAVATGVAVTGDTDATISISNGGVGERSVTRTYGTTTGEWDVVKPLNTNEWGSTLTDIQVKLAAPAADGSARISHVCVEVLHLT